MLLLPMGDFGDVAESDLVEQLQFEMQFMPQLLGTASIGYITWGEKISVHYLILFSGSDMVGAKYYLYAKRWILWSCSVRILYVLSRC